ncbi:hypothetical protein EZJ49_02110 [Bdellovibrio bacteriovorus]|uniref:hypothetical protein n=1 Tax=Bdellovibrio bacteriovorus TaxID=959 RepID=UPI0021CECD68|nr:hypothetical protein [Bdellovibrio bacteriovorus]UXR65043.1 hypothetical protein EZJ49_02110 [Bdellovibrio bacteriovorus]
MRFLRSALKYFAFFVLGLVTCAFVGVGAVTYYAVDYLTQNPSAPPVQKKPYPIAKASLTPELKTPAAPAPGDFIPESSKENFRSAFNTSRSFMKNSEQISHLIKQLEKAPLPPLCPSLCDTSAMDKEQLKTDRVVYLEQYLRSEGTRALQDPEFRLLMDNIGRIYHLIQPAQKILKKIDRLKAQQEKPEGASTTDKLLITAEIQGTLLSEFYGFVNHVEQVKAEDSKMKLIRDLRRACHKGKPVKQLISECDSILSR